MCSSVDKPSTFAHCFHTLTSEVILIVISRNICWMITGALYRIVHCILFFGLLGQQAIWTCVWKVALMSTDLLPFFFVLFCVAFWKHGPNFPYFLITLAENFISRFSWVIFSALQAMCSIFRNFSFFYGTNFQEALSPWEEWDLLRGYHLSFCI